MAGGFCETCYTCSMDIWTDGSCSAGFGGWACLIDGQLHSGVFGRTNNQAELYAILSGVERCPYGAEIHVYTDSKLAIGLLSWGWQTTKPVLAAIVRDITGLALARRQPIYYHKTKAHATDTNNVTVDHAARWQARLARKVQSATHSMRCSSPGAPSAPRAPQEAVAPS